MTEFSGKKISSIKQLKMLTENWISENILGVFAVVFILCATLSSVISLKIAQIFHYEELKYEKAVIVKYFLSDSKYIEIPATHLRFYDNNRVDIIDQNGEKVTLNGMYIIRNEDSAPVGKIKNIGSE